MGVFRPEYWSGCCALLQGIFPTRGWNLCLFHLLHWSNLAPRPRHCLTADIQAWSPALAAAGQACICHVIWFLGHHLWAEVLLGRVERGALPVLLGLPLPLSLVQGLRTGASSIR